MPITRCITRPILSHLSRAVTEAGRSALRLIEAFGTLTGWTVTTTGGAARISLSTGDGVFSTDCINFQTDAGAGQNASITANLEPDLDLSASDGFWMLTRTNVRRAAGLPALTIYLSHLDNLAAGSGRFQAITPVRQNAVSVQPHWVPRSRFTVLDGAPSFSNPIKSWRYRIDSIAGEAQDIELLGIFNERMRPTIIMTQDDGWASSYTVAFQECQARGIPQTHYLIGSLIGSASYVSLAQAQAMQAAGDVIGLHGVLLWCDDTSRIASDLTALQGLGFNPQHAAYPEGNIGAGTTWIATKAAIQEAGMKTARLSASDTPTLRHRTDPYCITAMALNSTLSLAAAKTAVDQCIQSGGTLFIYGHKYAAVADTETWVSSDFAALCDYIVTKRAAGLLDTKTVADWWGA